MSKFYEAPWIYVCEYQSETVISVSGEDNLIDAGEMDND